MFLFTRSLVEARGRTIIIIIHYCGFSGSSANSSAVQASEAVMYEKIRVWLSFPSDTQKSPRAATPSQHPHEQLLRSDTQFFYYRGPLAADDGSGENSTAVERQPG